MVSAPFRQRSLCSWSTQLGKQKFVTEVNYATPKLLVEKALAELQRIGKVTEPSGNTSQATQMAGNPDACSPGKSWAGAAARCKSQTSTVITDLVESQTAGNRAIDLTKGQEASTNHNLTVRGSAKRNKMGQQSILPCTSKQSTTSQVYASQQHLVIFLLIQLQAFYTENESALVSGRHHFSPARSKLPTHNCCNEIVQTCRHAPEATGMESTWHERGFLLSVG